MSRRRRPAGRRGGGGARTSRAVAQPAELRSRTATADTDFLTLYRESANYGRVIRGALALSLLLLAASLTARIAGGSPPPEIGAAGAVLMLVFAYGGVLKHLRAVRRIRRFHPGRWTPDGRQAMGMLTVVFGAGDPRNTAYDRAVLTLSGVLAVVLVVLLPVARALNR